MIRRSRISVRPNVRPAGRPPSASQDPSHGDPERSGSPSAIGRDLGAKPEHGEATPTPAASAEGASAKAEGQNASLGAQAESCSPTVHVGGITPSTAGTQRRKRITVLPNLAKPRTTTAPTPASGPAPSPAHTPTPALTRTSSRTPKSPVKTASAPEPGPTAPPPALPSAPQSPPHAPQDQSDCQVDLRGRKRPSGVGGRSKTPPTTCVEETPAGSLEQEDEGTQETESLSANQEAGSSCLPEGTQTSVSEIPTGDPECRPAQFERMTVLQEKMDGESPEKGEQHQPQSTAPFPLTLRTLNDPVDRLRLARAKKLRDLLKTEMRKDKLREKQQKPRVGHKVPKVVKDHTKMTMRELIYYLPSTNPMTSYMEDEQKATETVLPSSPKPAPVASPAAPPQPVEEEEEGEEGEGSRTAEEEALLAPRVKVAEDGSLIIDEESLTVEVLRVKGPNPAEGRDPIFERGSTTTYSSFRKGTYTKPWSSRETDMFFLAISMVGTDFSMIGQLFPHRTRVEIKNKFKKEERTNSWRVDKAFKERRRLDLEFFRDLLGKILQDQANKRKKKKSASKLASVPRTARGKAVRKRKTRSSCSEDESSGSDVMEGEKENEDVCDDGGLTGDPIRPRRNITGVSVKKARHTDKPDELVDTEDAENSTSEEQTPTDSSQELDSTGGKGEFSGVQPAQVRGRAQRSPAELGRGSGRRGSAGPSSALRDGMSEEEERRYTADVISCGLGDSEEEEEPNLTAIQEHIFNKPTRSGRIPKLSQHVIRAAASEEDEESSSVAPLGGSLARGPVGPGRRGRVKAGPSLTAGLTRRGRSRILTLLASTQEEDEEDEEEEEEQCPVSVEEENQAFVPMALRSVAPVTTEVEETMEELDISVNVPDVLGISHSAVCSESSCETALSTAGPVPGDHQLDLLVDVIEFLTPDHMEVSEESYAEAARTLLTIGHTAHVTPTSEPIISHMAHVTPTGEAVSTDDDTFFVEESTLSQQEVQQEFVLESSDESETTCETSHVVTSGLCVDIISDGGDGPDTVGDVSNLDHVDSRAAIPEPSQKDATFMEEPIISQESNLVVDHSHSRVSNITVPRRTLRPKPKLSPVPRHTRVRQKEMSAAAAVQNPLTGPPSAERLRAPGEACSTPNVTSPAGPQGRTSGSDHRTRGGGEGVSSGRPPDTPTADGASAGVVDVEQRVEVGQQSQAQLQSHSVSEPQTGPRGSQTSVQTSRALRRFRGPKPNVVRLSRTPRTQTCQNSAKAVADTFTDTQSTGGGANSTPEPGTSQSTAQERDSPQNSVMAVSSVRPGVTEEEESREAGFEPEPTSDEPVFILSLTEVPPTRVKEEEHRTEPLPLLATSELVSEPLSGGGPGAAGDLVPHLVLPEELLRVSAGQEGDGDGGEQNRESEEKQKEKNPTAAGGSGRCELLLSSAAEENSELTDPPDKRCKPPERTRRAKLQVRPNPVQRRGHLRLPDKDPPVSTPSDKTSGTPTSMQETMPTCPQETTPTSTQETTPTSTQTTPTSTQTTPTSTQETTLVAETVPVTTSLKDLSSALVEQAPRMSVRTARTKAPPTLPRPSSFRTSSRQSSASSSQPRSMDTPPPESAPEVGPSQSIVGHLDVTQVEETQAVVLDDVEAGGSGVESQAVCQITPVATTGPLSRPARRPRGFLSFMSSASAQGASPSKRSSQRPAVNTSRADQRRAAPGPLTSAGRAGPASRPCTTTPSQASTRPPLPPPALPQQCETSRSNPHAVEEPSSVSAYFLDDIFTVVDEPEMVE
ncbi:uncharacterized protein LOC143497174 isoform X2 [Brachyhypopomus gauderio]|uniref:uncharacterized protein LOC143497174 isoform X2 n=1 Tax=Brachyhypopomus gauderio TaxID=698409 RepID=UPI004043502A